MSNDNQLDPELLRHGDRRNVIDRYHMMTVEAITSDLDTKRHHLHVAIENFQHDFNIGTIVRNANAFNVEAVHIIGRRHWNKRGAMATEKYLHVYHHHTVAEFVSFVTNMKIIGVDNVAGSTALSTADLPKSAVYVFGGEGPGLSEEMKTHTESIIAIEQFGSTRSVNVGVASGIVLYEWARRNVL